MGGGEVSSNLESIEGGCFLELVIFTEGRDGNGLVLVALVEDKGCGRREVVTSAEEVVAFVGGREESGLEPAVLVGGIEEGALDLVALEDLNDFGFATF